MQVSFFLFVSNQNSVIIKVEHTGEGGKQRENGLSKTTNWMFMTQLLKGPDRRSLLDASLRQILSDGCSFPFP